MSDSIIKNLERELLARTEKLDKLIKEKQTLIRKFQEILDKLELDDYYMIEEAQNDYRKIIGDKNELYNRTNK